MAMSGDTLKVALKTAILTQLQTKFPVASNLQAAEKVLKNAAQSDLAEAIAYAIGPVIVSHITSNAVVDSTGTVISGLGAPGNITATGAIS